MIVLTKSQETSFGGGSVKPVKDFHITAHTSRPDNPKINKIKYSSKDADGNVFDGSVIVFDKKLRGLLYPLVTTFAGYLGMAFADQSKTSKERGTVSIPLIGIATLDNVMSYTLYAHSKHVDLPQVQGFNKYTYGFSRLSLTIYATFISAPAAMVYSSSAHIRIPMRKNGVFLSTFEDLIVPRMTSDGIERFLQSKHIEVWSYYLDYLRSLNKDVRPYERLLYPWGAAFRWPSMSDEVHEDYGEWARTKNAVYDSPKSVDGIPWPVGHKGPRGKIGTRLVSDDILEKYNVKRRKFPDSDRAV